MPDVHLPDGSIASFPDGTSHDDMIQAVQGHLGGANTAAQTSDSGSFLPVSRDAQGNPQFDSNAGIFGTIKRALTLPGDVYTGKTPILNNSSDTPGAYNPDLIRRSADLAGIMSPANPAMRAGDRAIPGAAMARTTPDKVTPPTALELKKVGGEGYDAARASGLEISGDAVGEMARGAQQYLQAEHGIIGKTAPKTYAILDELASPPDGAITTIAGIEAARRGLSPISREGGTDGLAAGHAVRRIDDFLSTLSDSAIAPSYTGSATAGDVANTLRTARANYAAAQRSNDLTGTLDRATTGISERAEARAQAANSGRNLDNSIRQRVASLLEKPKEVSGYSDAELEALRGVVSGGPARNSARYTGNLLGGGGGLGQAVAAGLGAAAGAGAGSNPAVGAAIGAAAPVAGGAFAKALANALAKRSLSQADELVRTRSPLYQDMLGQASQSVPGIDRNALLARLLDLSAAHNGVQKPAWPPWGSLSPK